MSHPTLFITRYLQVVRHGTPLLKVALMLVSLKVSVPKLLLVGMHFMKRNTQASWLKLQVSYLMLKKVSTLVCMRKRACLIKHSPPTQTGLF